MFVDVRRVGVTCARRPPVSVFVRRRLPAWVQRWVHLGGSERVPVRSTLQAWETCAVPAASLGRSAPAHVSCGPVPTVDYPSDQMPTVATGTRMAHRWPLDP
jgi:hypothetical protein